MYLENIVFDAIDPRSAGRAWEDVLGTVTLTDDSSGYETRLSVPDGPCLDLCFQPVPEEPTERPRLHLDVRDGVLTAIRVEAADPDRDRTFWQWLTGWQPVPSDSGAALRYPSGHGPLLAFIRDTAQRAA